MKKAEALKRIKEYMDINAGFLVPEQVLAVCEGLGMRPPSLGEDECQAIMDVYYAGYTFNQWEEDFVKDEKVQKALAKRLSWKTKSWNDDDRGSGAV